MNVIDTMFNLDASTPEMRARLMNSEIWPVVVEAYNLLRESGHVKIDRVVSRPLNLGCDLVDYRGLCLLTINRRSLMTEATPPYFIEVPERVEYADETNTQTKVAVAETKLSTLMHKLTRNSTFRDAITSMQTKAANFPADLMRDIVSNYGRAHMAAVANRMPFNIMSSSSWSGKDIATMMELAFGTITIDKLAPTDRSRLEGAFRNYAQSMTTYRNGLTKLLQFFSQDKWLIGFGRERFHSTDKPIILAKVDSSLFARAINVDPVPSDRMFYDVSLLNAASMSLDFQYYEDMEYLRQKDYAAYSSVNAAIAMYALNRGIEGKVFNLENYRDANHNMTMTTIWSETNSLAHRNTPFTMAWLMVDKY